MYNFSAPFSVSANITSEMLSIVGERERTHWSVMLVWRETLCAHAFSRVDMLREEYIASVICSEK